MLRLFLESGVNRCLTVFFCKGAIIPQKEEDNAATIPPKNRLNPLKCLSTGHSI